MSWFKVDDGFYSHHKVILIPRAVRAEAIGTWTICGTWSADKLKDGHVPTYMVEELGGSLAGASALCDVKLWRKKANGFQFINWSEFQPVREVIEKNREKERDRKAAYRAKHNTDGDLSEDVPTGQERFPNTPTRPDPTRPKDSSTKSPSTAKRGTRVDPNFVITPAMREWAKTNTPLVDVDAKLPAWIDYWKGVPGAKGVKLDWAATWNNGMRKQQEFAVRDLGTGSTAPKKRFTAHDE